MKLDEAIQHCEEVSNRERELYKMCPENCNGSPDCRELKHGKDKGCLKCAEEHEQLAEWLKELKAYKEAEAEKEAQEEARREAMRLDDNEDTLKWKGTH